MTLCTPVGSSRQTCRFLREPPQRLHASHGDRSAERVRYAWGAIVASSSVISIRVSEHRLSSRPESPGRMSAAMLFEMRTALSQIQPPRKVRIAPRRLRLGVPEQAPDHRQAPTERKGTGGQDMPPIT